MERLERWQSLPPPPLPQHSQALHEGGEAGVVEGLALTGRRLPPLECLGMLTGEMGDADVMGVGLRGKQAQEQATVRA